MRKNLQDTQEKILIEEFLFQINQKKTTNFSIVRLFCEYVINNQDRKDLIDILLYGFTEAYNNKKENLMSIILKTIDKIEIKYFAPFKKEIEHFIEVINDPEILIVFIDILFILSPGFVLKFLDKRKKFLHIGYLKKIYETLKAEVEEYAYLKLEVEEIIKRNLSQKSITFKNIDYFDYI